MPRVAALRPVPAASGRAALSPGLAGLLSLVLPSLCVACGSPRRGFGGGGACTACWRSVAAPEPGSCFLCALPSEGSPCPACRRSPPPVSAAAAAGAYEGTLRRLVRSFKFEGHDILAPHFAERMARAARESGVAEGVDTLCAIPSTRARNRERGYDPGPLLALETARLLRLPFASLLARTRATVPQSSLPAAARHANVAGAFTAPGRARGRILLLVDDVMTTGATAFEAAASLRAAGAASVRLLVLARTPQLCHALPEAS